VCEITLNVKLPKLLSGKKKDNFFLKSEIDIKILGRFYFGFYYDFGSSSKESYKPPPLQKKTASRRREKWETQSRIWLYHLGDIQTGATQYPSLLED